MLDQDVLAIADQWWARGFACSPGDLRPTTTHVQAHAGSMQGAAGIWILVVGEAPLVSLPNAVLDQLSRRAQQWSSSLVADPSALALELAELSVQRIVGPAYIGYRTACSLDLSLADGARAVTAADDLAVAHLRADCSDEAWDHGGCDHHVVPAFGCFVDGALCALSGYKTWGETIAHISVVSARAHRGAGRASAAVACAARHAFTAGLVPQYRTLAANGPSMGIATKLGFERYGFSIFVRLNIP